MRRPPLTSSPHCIAALIAWSGCAAQRAPVVAPEPPATLPAHSLHPRGRSDPMVEPLTERAPFAVRVSAPALPLPVQPACVEAAATPPPLPAAAATATFDDRAVQAYFDAERRALSEHRPRIACHVYAASEPAQHVPQAHVALGPGEATSFSIGDLDFLLAFSVDLHEGSRFGVHVQRAFEELSEHAFVLSLSAPPEDLACGGPGFTGYIHGRAQPSPYVFFCTVLGT